MPIRESTVFDRNRNALPSDVLSERESRIAQYTAEAAKHETPDHGIAPRRGVPRPIVILTIPDPSSPVGARIEPSVTSAARLIGIKDCSICEALRERRPARGHVFRYLDQIQRSDADDNNHMTNAPFGVGSLSDRERAALGPVNIRLLTAA